MFGKAVLIIPLHKKRDKYRFREGPGEQINQPEENRPRDMWCINSPCWLDLRKEVSFLLAHSLISKWQLCHIEQTFDILLMANLP